MCPHCGAVSVKAGGWVGSGCSIWSRHKMALLICPCAVRLRRHSPINGSSEMSKCISTHRLAQNVRLTSGARHFPRELSHKMAFVRCQCAFPLRSRRLAQNMGPGGPGLGIHLLPGSFLVKIFLQPSKGSLHDLVHVRRSREILVRSFVGGSLHDLVQVLVRRSCGDWSCSNPASKALAWRSWRCSAIAVLVWKFFRDAPRNFLYESLVVTSI